MFAVDDETGELTRDGQPVSDQLQRVFDLLGCDAKEFEQVLAREWEWFEVPRSDELLWLPCEHNGPIWDGWVDELAVAYRSGPMTTDGWQRIYRSNDIYFVVDGGGGAFDVTVIGIDAFDEAIEAASGFIKHHDGRPLSIWSDRDDPQPEDMMWSADDDWDEDDEDDLTEDEREAIAEARAWQQRLWDTVITHEASGVILAGRGGSSPLPGEGTWYVVPIPSERFEELMETLNGMRVTVSDEGFETEALLTQYVDLSAAARMAEAFGSEVLWELTNDEVRLIRCDPYAVVANALRDMA